MRPTTLIGTGPLTAGAAIIGSVASRSSIDSWYRNLRKPVYVPPDAVFPLAWTALYADIAVSAAAVLDSLRTQGRSDEARTYALALLTNLTLNAGWSWVFFKKHHLGAAAVTAAALTASSADLARRSTTGQSAAALALTPYPLWCAFATVLSTAIWRLNR